MNDAYYGWGVDCDWDWLNLLIEMKAKNPQRFYAFYNDASIYYYMEKLQDRQHTLD
jgi:hypothetical protein